MVHILVCKSVCLDSAHLLSFRPVHVVLGRSWGQEAWTLVEEGVWRFASNESTFLPVVERKSHLSVIGKEMFALNRP